jgi:hypothetical protein
MLDLHRLLLPEPARIHHALGLGDKVFGRVVRVFGSTGYPLRNARRDPIIARTARGARCGACRSLRQLDDHLAGVRSRQQPIHRWDHVFQALNQVCGLQTAPADPAMENFRTKNNSVRSGLLLTFQGCQVLKTPRLRGQGKFVLETHRHSGAGRNPDLYN